MVNFDEQKALGFLQNNGFAGCILKKVAGDASFRSYYRVFAGERTFILMFAPPKYEDVVPFIEIARFLRGKGFLAPEIYAEDFGDGFLLLEDFGDESFAKVLRGDAVDEGSLYRLAIDVLLDLHKIEAPKGLAAYNHRVLFEEVMLFVDWYLRFEKGLSLSLDEIKRFKRLWFGLFDKLSEKNCLVLRDYHVDNLMVLSGDRVGLLDFQDALFGVAAYDLVSLLEDARRDVSSDLQGEMLDYYFANFDGNCEVFAQDYEILSLQRNIKIIGIFARLAHRDGKQNYLDFLPRVIGYVRNRLSCMAKRGGDFAEIAGFFDDLM